MRFKRPGVVGMVLALAFVPMSSAQLMRVKGEGSLEHLNNAGAAPGFLPGWAEVRFDFRLGGVAEGERVSYVAAAARLWVGEQDFVLQNATFDVWRSGPGAEPFTSYLLLGQTKEGWGFSLQNDFAAVGDEAGFPRLLVSPGELLVHDLSFRAGDFSWEGYGDGVITSIEMVPAPEPASYAVAGVVVLGVSVLLRRRRRNRAKT